jgi:hypothetical protein
MRHQIEALRKTESLRETHGEDADLVSYKRFCSATDRYLETFSLEAFSDEQLSEWGLNRSRSEVESCL